MANECFIGEAGRLFIEIGCDGTIDSFRKIIAARAIELEPSIPRGANAFSYCGAIVLQELITEKLKKCTINRVDSDITIDMIERRLEYFRSPSFLERFMAKLPIRDRIENSVIESSYSVWFDTIFNVKYKGWREEKLSRVDNQSQCRRALGLPPGQIIPNLQQLGNITCYLCGQIILPIGTVHDGSNTQTMECEHKLSIMPALCHWWLIKAGINEYSPEALRDLKEEYAWSHRCCNQIKDNYEFIYYDKEQQSYQCNKQVIEYILTQIQTSRSYDCPSIRTRKKIDIPKQAIAICKNFAKILINVNANLKKCDDYDVYTLLTKYKVLSALSNDDFMTALAGNGELLEIPLTIEEIKAKKKALKAERKKMEADAAEAEKLLEDLKKEKSKSDRQARSAAKEKKKTGGGPEDIKVVEKAIEELTKSIEHKAEAIEKLTKSIKDKEEEQKILLDEEDEILDIILTDGDFVPEPEEFENELTQTFYTTHTTFLDDGETLVSKRPVGTVNRHSFFNFPGGSAKSNSQKSSGKGGKNKKTQKNRRYKK